MKVGRHRITISHPDKTLFPDAGLTKHDVADYYRRIAPRMVPLIRDRPLTLHRFPDGIEHDGFYQQQAAEHFPGWTARARLPRESGGEVEHAMANNAAILVWLANQGCITLHAWTARTTNPRHPDRMVFDLDPSDDDFGAVCRAARTLRDVLTDIGLTGFVMSTGSRGLHVRVVLKPEQTFDEVRAFAGRIAAVAAAREPRHLTTRQRKSRRGGRLYLDNMRNAYGQTAVAPYAVRALPHAPVALPLDWHELGRRHLRADSYRIDNVFRRLAHKVDPWHGMARHAVSLAAHEAALQAAETDRD